MNRDIMNIVAGGLLCLGAVGLIAYTQAAHYQVGEQVAFDAGLMPRIWLTIAAASAAVMVLQGVWGMMRREAGPAARLYRIQPGLLVVSGGLLVAFVAGFVTLGYWVTVLVFIPVFSFAFGYRNPIAIAATTVGFATVIWLVFVDLLLVQLPTLPAFW